MILKMDLTEVCGCSSRCSLHSSHDISTFPSLSILSSRGRDCHGDFHLKVFDKTYTLSISRTSESVALSPFCRRAAFISATSMTPTPTRHHCKGRGRGTPTIFVGVHSLEHQPEFLLMLRTVRSKLPEIEQSIFVSISHGNHGL